MTGEPRRACGFCCECGADTTSGRVVGDIDQGSGGGFTVIVCRQCDKQPDGPPARPPQCSRGAR